MKSTPSYLQRLSDREAASRRAAGQGNDIPIQTSRTYSDILRDNFFTFMNGSSLLASAVAARQTLTH